MYKEVTHAHMILSCPSVTPHSCHPLSRVVLCRQSGCEERALDSVQLLSTSAWRLQNESAGLLAAAGAPTPQEARAITQQVIQMAFEVAKGAKQLVMIYQ